MTSADVPDQLTVVTDDTFERDVLRHDKPVLVDFWAEWCPPCRVLAPILAEIARERADVLSIRKLNTDENPRTTRDYQVMSAPTLMLFREGSPIRMLVGSRPKARLLAELDDALLDDVLR